ncbi:hypothetical protein CONLIGDRAFT_649862 [Coniochaeta ligniaria NRRL 30616]|uniref:Uncharacterized protein n=1 Tax=Coniochaeta ligniaria NRRL 30616 TaxID=1408157 RepID=A0A1J7IQG8_9PEZI|nr:hypothetical protein CONLIGDRAFT_649862 [Coniochaeta ligniaria NRRL 30616]
MPSLPMPWPPMPSLLIPSLPLPFTAMPSLAMPSLPLLSHAMPFMPMPFTPCHCAHALYFILPAAIYQLACCSFLGTTTTTLYIPIPNDDSSFGSHPGTVDLSLCQLASAETELCLTYVLIAERLYMYIIVLSTRHDKRDDTAPTDISIWRIRFGNSISDLDMTITC